MVFKPVQEHVLDWEHIPIPWPEYLRNNLNIHAYGMLNRGKIKCLER
jgi:hypothetical protein